MDKFRVGIIGCGGAGTAHARYYSFVPGCVVTKAFDVKKEGLARMALVSREIRLCSDLEEFWEGLDAVSVCAPDSVHADYIAEALRRGLHVICEKPLTDSVEGLRKILAAEKSSGKTLAVLHQMRFVPLHRKIKSMLEEGRLGKISYLEGYYVHNLIRRAFLNDTWRETDNATPLVYAGCHFIDLLSWFQGEEIVEAYAMANHLAFPRYPESDMNVALFRFAGGAVGKVLVAFGASCPQDHSIRLYGDAGSIDGNVLFGPEKKRTIIHSPSLVDGRYIDRSDWRAHAKTFYAEARKNAAPYLYDKAFRMLSGWLGRRRLDGEIYERAYPLRIYEHESACIDAIADFVDASRRSRSQLCTAEQAGKTVLAGLAGVESFRTRKPVVVKHLHEII